MKIKEIYYWIKDDLSFLRRCASCRQYSCTVRKRHNTFQYQEEELNYNTVCLSCMNGIWAEAKERWDDYYSEIGY